jgi:hypothetical protein
MPSAFGRADSGHMQMAAFPALLVGALSISSYRRTATCFGAFFLLTAIAVPASKIYLNATHRSLGYWSQAIRSGSIAVDKPLIVPNSTGIDALAQVPKGVLMNAPLGYIYRGYIDQSGRIDYGYFSRLEGVLLPSQVDAIINWLEKNPERRLIMNRESIETCYEFSEGTQSNLEEIYSVPFSPRPKKQMRVIFPLCDYIRAHYVPSAMRYKNDAQIWEPIHQ